MAFCCSSFWFFSYFTCKIYFTTFLFYFWLELVIVGTPRLVFPSEMYCARSPFERIQFINVLGCACRLRIQQYTWTAPHLIHTPFTLIWQSHPFHLFMFIFNISKYVWVGAVMRVCVRVCLCIRIPHVLYICVHHTSKTYSRGEINIWIRHNIDIFYLQSFGCVSLQTWIYALNSIHLCSIRMIKWKCGNKALHISTSLEFKHLWLDGIGYSIAFVAIRRCLQLGSIFFSSFWPEVGNTLSSTRVHRPVVAFYGPQTKTTTKMLTIK